MQVLKLVKKAAKRKQIKRGVKEVIKSIRKKSKGYVFLFASRELHPSPSCDFYIDGPPS